MAKAFDLARYKKTHYKMKLLGFGLFLFFFWLHRPISLESKFFWSQNFWFHFSNFFWRSCRHLAQPEGPALQAKILWNLTCTNEFCWRFYLYFHSFLRLGKNKKWLKIIIYHKVQTQVAQWFACRQFFGAKFFSE